MTLMTRLFGFRGGLHLDYRKEISTGTPIRVAPVPPQLVLPLSQHAGAPAKPRVRVGEQVLRGQTLADPEGFVSVPVHAPTSGTIVAIEPRPVPHASGLPALCIVLEADGQDAALPQTEWPAVEDVQSLEPQAIRDIVRRAGIAGLGGAGFPSFIKLGPGRPVEALIINGAECEPYISCDQMLMAERADEIVAGVQVILRAIGAPRCLIGVEDNKPPAIAALRRAASVDARIQVVVVPTRYPQGGEKQLIQALTGKEVPSEGLPLDIGYVVHNPGTARAVWRAVRYAEPLTARVVTVTGGAVKAPQNVEARIGTPMRFLIDFVGGYVGTPGRLLMGGPMMGLALSTDELPVIKSTNCILAATAEELRPADDAMPCIRCGACQEACPINLMPQQLYWHARGKEFDKTRELNLFDCIECGCCAQVCPSHIPLVQYYRYAKTEIWSAEREKRKADAARERHEARQIRIEREEREKEAARARKKAELAARKAATEATAASVPAATSAGISVDDPVARAIAAAKARRAVNAPADAAATSVKDASGSGADTDAVAKAIAAAQAKKAVKAAAAETSGTGSADKGDAVALAIAAAKAKKAAKAAADSASPDADDAVSLAIAAAKAKKHAQEQLTDAPSPAKPGAAAGGTDNDPVARAIAAAKAKKLAREAAAPTQGATAGDDDPVARAIAAAKARKAAKDAAATGDKDRDA